MWEITWLREAFATGEFVRRDEAQIKSSGYVVHTHEAALWGFFGMASVEEGVVTVVNLGDGMLPRRGSGRGARVSGMLGWCGEALLGR